MRKVSPSMFVLIVLLFFLPFVTLSCDGRNIASLSGINLVTGTTIQVEGGFSKESKKVDPVGAAAFAFFAAIGGAALYFWQHKLQPVAGAALGVAGAISLLAMRSGMAKEVAKDNITVSSEVGLTLSVMLFFAAALFNLYQTLLAPDAPFKIATLQAAPTGRENQAASDQRRE